MYDYNPETLAKMRLIRELIENSNLTEVFHITTSLLMAASVRLNMDVGLDNEFCFAAVDKLEDADFSIRQLHHDLKDSGLL